MRDNDWTDGGGDSSDLHLTEDLCVDLLHGLLDPVYRNRVMEHMRTCPDCEALFRRLVAEREHLRAVWALDISNSGELVAQRRVAGSAKSATLRAAWALRRGRFSAWTAGVAVAAALVLAFVWPQLHHDDSAVLPGLPAYSDDIRFRTAFSVSFDETLIAGLKAYDEADLAQAITLLETADVAGSLDSVRKLYLGSALARDGRYEEAVGILTQVAHSAVPDPWGSESRWTLFVSLWHTGRHSRADSLLEVLTSEAGEVGRRARQRQADDNAS